MSKETFTRILTRDKVEKIPEGWVHFYHPSDKTLLDIPLDVSYAGMEEIKKDLKKHTLVDEWPDHQIELSGAMCTVVKVVASLGLRNFVIEYIDDLDWAMYEFIQYVVKDGEVLAVSLESNIDEEGELYSDLQLDIEYAAYLYSSYEQAVKKFKFH